MPSSRPHRPALSLSQKLAALATLVSNKLLPLFAFRKHRAEDMPPEALIGKGVRFVKRIYRLRVIGLGIGFFCVAAGFLQALVAPPLWVLLVFHGFIWPHLARYWALNSAIPYRAERRNLVIDAGFGGFWIAAMQGNLIPATVIIAMLSMDNIAAGGMRLFVRGLYASLTGFALGWLLLGFEFTPQSDLTTIVACLPMLVLYPLVLGKSTYDMSKKLAERSRAFEIVSQQDGLTGLLNRRYWETQLIEEFDNCHRGTHDSCLLLLDLDHFKNINDTHGHLVGDEVLRNFSALLRENLRADDAIGRYGGEEFVVILRKTALAEALALSQRVIDKVREQRELGNRLQGCTVSAGLVPFSHTLEAHFSWLQRADHAMYCAKEQGRDCLMVEGEDGQVSAISDAEGGVMAATLLASVVAQTHAAVFSKQRPQA
ncbi:diguanylate cyclase [Herbaspirillum lusitanum]|uniref:diguanylate cyclase n=1 Tax=Herbaspirillum lusitanum TaxID=213312 RepID=A0ABW9A603_9BURK